MIKLARDVLTDFGSSTSREWLETNGIGGYASSTASGANSRRYHGLLVAATRPPLGRVVMLSKLEETLIVGDEQFSLSCNRYPGVIHPDGFKYLTGFRPYPFPTWTYEVGPLTVKRSLFMIYGENSTVIRWKLANGPENADPVLELKPLTAFRNHHHLRREDLDLDGEFEVNDGLISICPYPEMPRLYIAHNAITAEPQGHWYRDLEYEIERERGFDHQEDLFQPFSLKFDLSREAVIIGSTEERNVADARLYEESEIERRESLIATAGTTDEFSSQLVIAADQFVVSRGNGKTVIAGYHWFSDWGRDTMIALNGLTLATNRPEIARSILTEFAKYISEGILPNRFPDEGETPDYNTVDATLWFFEAIRAYIEKTDDVEIVRTEFYEKLVNIIEWHSRGTRHQIHVDTDGLLFAGEPGVQLTWMDAKIGDWVITPRTGKAVEIQALWYNALCIMSDLAHRFGDTDGRHTYRSMAVAAKASFNGQFWNEEQQCLFDVVNGSKKDGSVRPNQIFAVSLKHTMLDPERSLKVVNKVESELLTPVGLRSLSPNDANYVGVYAGSPRDRDAAYHQGTVWGWLIGPFIDAYRRVHSADDRMEERVRDMMAGFRAHISEASIGQISEIFDGDQPHDPRGCAAQAWSVAELLRVTMPHSE